MNIPKELIDKLPEGTVPCPDVNIKSFKSCNGRDGLAFSCTLYLDNKKAADIMDSGNGGEMMIYWTDKILQQKWDIYISSLPKYTCKEFPGLGEMTYTSDTIIEKFINALELCKYFKHNCKNKIVIQFKNKPLGDVTILNVPITLGFTDTMREKVIDKYGDDILFIANDIIS